MRVFIFATHHGDYSVELATALSQQSEVALFIEEGQCKNDCGAAQIAAFAQRGLFKSFSKRIVHRVSTFFSIVIGFLKFRPDFFIAHAHYDRYTLFLQFVLSRFCPLYLIVHDPAPHAGRDAEVSARADRLDRWGRDLASAFIVHGAFCAQQLEKTGIVKGRPVLSVPHGPMLRPEKDVAPTSPPFVLMFGRMEAYKGLGVLLAACERLVARGTPIALKLMGRGAELEQRKTAFEAAGAQVFCQFIPRETAVQALQEASAVVAPYTEATQSGVVAAAFASGQPIVATAVGGLVDFIRDGENGLLIPANDPDALADALSQVLTDAVLRQRLAAGAVKTAAEDISWDRYVEVLTAAQAKA